MGHTFCTRKANAGMNPKALQYIMGHANIVMTLNYYAHTTFNSAKAELDRLDAGTSKIEKAWKAWSHGLSRHLRSCKEIVKILLSYCMKNLIFLIRIKHKYSIFDGAMIYFFCTIILSNM